MCYLDRQSIIYSLTSINYVNYIKIRIIIKLKLADKNLNTNMKDHVNSNNLSEF